jgi:hypothetical protein
MLLFRHKTADVIGGLRATTDNIGGFIQTDHGLPPR